MPSLLSQSIQRNRFDETETLAPGQQWGPESNWLDCKTLTICFTTAAQILWKQLPWWTHTMADILQNSILEGNQSVLVSRIGPSAPHLATCMALTFTLESRRGQWVSRFLTAHQHSLGYLVPVVWQKEGTAITILKRVLLGKDFTGCNCGKLGWLKKTKTKCISHWKDILYASQILIWWKYKDSIQMWPEVDVNCVPYWVECHTR